MRPLTQDSDKANLRFPEGLRQRLKEVARDNGRSMNAEIVVRLEASFQSKMPFAADLWMSVEDYINRSVAERLATIESDRRGGGGNGQA